MIIVMEHEATKEQIAHAVSVVESKKLRTLVAEGVNCSVINVIGEIDPSFEGEFAALPGVRKTVRIGKPYKRASKVDHVQRTVIKIGDVEIGNGHCTVIAGPCSVESEEQLMQSAEMLKKAGVKIMRASAFKPRTSPYDFQGLGVEGLKMLKRVSEKTGLLTETEVMDVRDVQLAAEYVDILRVGARNMHNFDLLKELGKVKNPVILKRGMAATVKEFILAGEYVLSHGNPNLIFCERGIRTFETAYRNTLDVGCVAILKKETHLPVIVDPSHAAGKRDLVTPLSMAAVAAGADGLLVEAHPDPEKAWSDGAQSLYPDQLTEMMDKLRPICAAVGKKL